MAPEKQPDKRMPIKPMNQEQLEALRRAQVSRRSLIKRSGGVAALTVGSGAVTAALPDSAAVQEGAPPTEAPYPYTFQGVPDTPEEPPAQEFVAFSEEQAAIVEALTSRILPGSPDDPGAREAGVVYYIDFILSRNSGIHEATYTDGPYAKTYDEGDTPPDEDDDDTVWVQAGQISRYGFQAPLSPLDAYEIALPLVHDYALQEYGGPVQDLSEEDQDQIVWDLLEDNVPGFEQFPPSSFFHTLRRHTAEGMFSDPAYGGNRDMVGWQLVGYPGAQRAYSEEELVTEDEPRPPQAMNDLPYFNPGVTTGDEHHHNVLQPVRDPTVDDVEDSN